MALDYSYRVTFADTDAAGIAHFSRMLTWVEAAEHAWFTAASLPILTLSDQAGWPRVGLQVAYHQPARFGDQLLVRLTEFTVGTTSLTYRFSVLQSESKSCHEVFSGEMSLVRVVGARPATIPVEWQQSLAAHVEQRESFKPDHEQVDPS
jgi:YbgC/YbaW family acyl-CoA thioester hydrolase